MEMKLTKEQALFYHRQMWSDMQKELGNYAMGGDRALYKSEWCQKHFPNERIANDCFLCEYVEGINPEADCEDTCPIKWVDGNCISDNPANSYETMPISKLLALPEREFNEVN